MGVMHLHCVKNHGEAKTHRPQSTALESSPEALWQPSALDQRLHLGGSPRSQGTGPVGLAAPQRSCPGRRSPRTFFQVRCLNRNARSVVPREVGDVHVEAPDDAVHTQPHDAPVVTWGHADTTSPSDRTCQVKQVT